MNAANTICPWELPHPGWDNLTREELLAELTRLQAENARLTALLPAPPPLQGDSVQLVQRELSPAVRNTDAPTLSPQQKVQLFRRLFLGACWAHKKSQGGEALAQGILLVERTSSIRGRPPRLRARQPSHKVSPFHRRAN
jgi:hypothetical protein